MLESLRGFPSCMPSALKLASVLFIECAIIVGVGVGLLIARGIARVLLKAYHVRTYVRPQHYDPSTTSRHFGAETKRLAYSEWFSIPQALLALDQLHRVAPAHRKQYFLLNHLEPEVGISSNKGVKTAVSIAVEIIIIMCTLFVV